MGRFLDHDEIADLAARGHEIACHTYSHLDCGRALPDATGEDCERNREALARKGFDLRHFAYPYGEVSASAKAMLGAHYGSMRALHPGLVRRGSDRNQLPAVGIEGADGLDRARRWIDRAVQERAWLILYSHDVRESPSDFGCTPGTLERLVSHAKASGARIARVGDVI
jgi:peptidoglycan/xylan/chitin deacetylase (PgdA/CDA1 family)